MMDCMAYNLVKLVLVVALAAFIIVAMGVDWVGETQGWAAIGILIGYVVGNISVLGISPIISRPVADE